MRMHARTHMRADQATQRRTHTRPPTPPSRQHTRRRNNNKARSVLEEVQWQGVSN